MDSIDLLALVKAFGKLDGIELYGYISSSLPRPINLFDTCKTQQGGSFVKMDVLAVNLQRYSQYLKQMGITNKENDDIYLVNGSVALYVSNRGVFPDWYATRGTLRLGSKTDSYYLNLFPFRKSGNDWGIEFNALDTMEISNWGRQSRLYLSVKKSLENGFVTVPNDVARLPRFTARLTQGVITPIQQPKGTPPSLADSLQSAMNGVVPQVNISKQSNTFEVVDRDDIVQPNEIYKNLKDNE